jgi:hypothetical protein
MSTLDFKHRAKLFVQRFWQPTSACMTCMPGSLGNVFSPSHWATAVQTGLATGILVLVLSFTPLGRLFRNRFGNALAVGCFTVIGDAYSHPGHYGFEFAEAALTGVVSFCLALAGSYVLEYFIPRVKRTWSRLKVARSTVKT